METAIECALRPYSHYHVVVVGIPLAQRVADVKTASDSSESGASPSRWILVALIDVTVESDSPVLSIRQIISEKLPRQSMQQFARVSCLAKGVQLYLKQSFLFLSPASFPPSGS